MHKIILAICAALTAISLSSPATAAQSAGKLYIGNNVWVMFEAPEGMCMVDPNDSITEQAFFAQREEALKQDDQKLRRLFMDCDSLPAFRNGSAKTYQKRLQIMTFTTKGVDDPAEKGDRREFLRGVTGYSKEAYASIPVDQNEFTREIKKRLGLTFDPNARENEYRKLGILAADNNAVYSGDYVKPVAIITTATLLREQMVLIDYAAKYRDVATFETLLAQSKEMAFRAVEASETAPINDEPPASADVASATPASHAIDLDIGNRTSMKYEAPEGMCFIDPARTAGEKSLFETSQYLTDPATTKLRAVVVGCESLDDIKMGGDKNIERWVMIETFILNGADNPPLAPAPRAHILQGALLRMQEHGDALPITSGDFTAELTKRIAPLNSKENKGAVDLGAVAIDNNAIYTSSIASEAIFMEATLPVKNQLIRITNYKDYKGVASVETALSEAKEMARHVLALNENTTHGDEASNAHAVEFDIGNRTSIKFEAPEGLCFINAMGSLDEQSEFRWRKRRMEKFGFVLRGIFIDCASRTTEKKYIDQWIEVRTDQRDEVGDPSIDPVNRSTYVKGMEGATREGGGAIKDLKETGRAMANTLAMDESKDLGVLGMDGNGVYMGFLKRMASEQPGREKTGSLLATVLTFTVVKNQRLTIENNKDYTGADTFEALLAQSKAMAASAVAMNDDPNAAPVPERPERPKSTGYKIGWWVGKTARWIFDWRLPIGGAILVIGGIALLRRRSRRLKDKARPHDDGPVQRM